MYSKVYNIIKESVDRGELAGANLLIRKEGEEKLYCEYGYRDIKSKKPITRDTLFRIYSQTKPVTAAAAILLCSEGKIDIRSPLSDFFPEYSEMYTDVNGRLEKSAHPILIKDLLNMTSGISYPDKNSPAGRSSEKVFAELDRRLYTDNPMTTKEFAEKMSSSVLAFNPGEGNRYGASADILGAVIEKASGMSFGEFLKKRFFEPLSMNDTDFYVPREKQERLAKVYDCGENGPCEVCTNHLGLRYMRDEYPAFESGGAGLISTLDDYAKFAQMLLNGGEYWGRRIMPRFAVKYLTNSTNGGKQAEEDGFSYGNLMRVCTDESKTVFFASKGEYGWDGWLGTSFLNDPKNGMTFLFGVQQIDQGGADPLKRKLHNIIKSELL